MCSVDFWFADSFGIYIERNETRLLTELIAKLCVISYSQWSGWAIADNGGRTERSILQFMNYTSKYAKISRQFNHNEVAVNSVQSDNCPKIKLSLP